MKNNFILDKVYHEFQQGGGFFQGAVWVWQITSVLPEGQKSKWLKHKPIV
jgi:hypothetical protein